MVERTINIERLEQMTDIFGSFDENIGILERELGVTVLNRNTELKVVGDEERADRAVRVIESLLVLSSRGEGINEQNIRYAIGLVEENKEEQIAELSRDVICITVKGKPIKPKTIGQRDYINAIQNNTVTLGVGPAGTGKTYLAVAAAVKAFREKKVNRIILTRPAIEAGEKLGFLPGDLQSKVDPYLRPLYDGLYDMIGPEAFQRYMERGTIEVAPLAYMRGRTLDDSFIILDEAQNTTPEQMKMFLTRLGFNSKAVITGDITQIDLPDGKSSGLRDAMRVLDGIEDVAMCMLSSKDVVRHVLVQRIINAYEKRDREREKKLQHIRKDNKNGRA
ncbi:MAG: PhoH family protein [Oscillospiraceae bacterium]|nr:PhoH family protein [Oscillospiraceae bacterium]